MSIEFPKIENQSEKLLDFEKWLELELPKQYEEKVEILNKLGILENLPETKDFGIVGIDGKEYPIPKVEEIKDSLEKNKEIFAIKMKQGFTDLNIIPFGTELSKLIEIMKKAILKHYQEGKLFTAKNNLEDGYDLVRLDLDENNPIYECGAYYDADTEGELVYYPQEFSENHQGKTKREILAENKKGFIVTMQEKNPNIPKANDDPQIMGGRERLRGNKSSNKFLKLLQTQKQYQNEQGQTPEEWITKFLTYLEKHNQVIDDVEGNGTASCQLGAYFHSLDRVPLCWWYRVDRQAGLDRINPRRQETEKEGASLSVRVI